ncbi:MAG TPA: hypothetical protein VKG89_09260 [Solirubrobacterales bacterium]|nr:hypothetical protein [Solirubrobacterales bacterium]
MKLRFGMAAIAIVAVGAAAGCGSSSSSSTTSTQAALTKSEFLAKGNAICKKGNQTINKAAHQTFAKGQKPTKSETQDFATKTVIPSIQQQISAIKALPPPSGDEAQVTKIVDDAQAALDKAKQNPTLLTGNGPDPFKQVNKETKAYGLTACGGGGG